MLHNKHHIKLYDVIKLFKANVDILQDVLQKHRKAHIELNTDQFLNKNLLTRDQTPGMEYRDEQSISKSLILRDKSPQNEKNKKNIL